MIVYLNRAPKLGPWGGGAKTVNLLCEKLQDRGHQVVFSLVPDIDIMFCFDPRPNQFGEDYGSMLNYKLQNTEVKIIQRIGDIGTHGKPDLNLYVKESIKYSDYCIFPSMWSKKEIGYTGVNHAVINNAPMPIFYKDRSISRSPSNIIRIVTHHWSTNPKKGFSLYKELEAMQDENDFRFEYIGRTPAGLSFINQRAPMSASDLASALPTHDIYLTASEEEAGANHVLEAMAAGLPVVYTSKGGSIVDYCSDYGVSFEDSRGAVACIEKIKNNYAEYKNRVLSYTSTNQETIERYCEIVEMYET